MPFPKGNTALDCCWQVRASHHPRQPLSCRDLPARGAAGGTKKTNRKPLFRQNKTKARAFRVGGREGGTVVSPKPRLDRDRGARGVQQRGSTAATARWESTYSHRFNIES